ncbi:MULTISPECIES: gamma-glutamylcyclotransferase family protein [Xanthobacter]|uniref:gamma-glutamylcyclotransferase family protein n=1 Tax=Xanthobacter TaxID=279 RepID=UPI0017BDB06E|nr:gamma-glutamylcyclotransferase [Xanthobacter sp. SG618]NMN56550.1 cation transport regulator ChaC [Xanthobacter sp. SG618]
MTITRRGVLGGLAGLAASSTLPAAAKDFWGQRLANAPREFLFGYGSLISGPSRTATSGRPVPAIAARISGSFGYVRSWASRFTPREGTAGFTALGIRPRMPGEEPGSINGVIFPVKDEAELAAFDAREGGYDRVELDQAHVEAIDWEGLPRVGKIWVYVPKESAGKGPADLQQPDVNFPLLQSYIDVVMQGSLDEGPDFARELIETTLDWSPFWLDDRPIARRAWADTPRSGAIDRLLATVEPAASQFRNRLYPELYAVRHLMGKAATPPR